LSSHHQFKWIIFVLSVLMAASGYRQFFNSQLEFNPYT